MVNEIWKNFSFEGRFLEAKPWGNGHINDTFLLVYNVPEKGRVRYILQRINKSIFTRPVELMENIIKVTKFLEQKIIEAKGNPERETLNIICAKDGKPYYIDERGEYWRAYKYIEGATSYERVRSSHDFYESAVAFGNFQRLLAEFPAESLYETIVGFHDTRMRFEAFKKAVEEDACGRVKNVKEEINFVLAREDIVDVFGALLAKGEVPLRVTHNDTKLNNILIDDETHRAICVIDLDTVMPGLVMNDFGDAIRFGASTAAEDETDLKKVWCDLELFEIYTKGYIEGCQGSLTQKEIEMFPMGAKLMTFECGMRFLMDYIQGDIYYKICREQHNLDRCRTQFKLVADMENKWDELQNIIKKYKS